MTTTQFRIVRRTAALLVSLGVFQLSCAGQEAGSANKYEQYLSAAHARGQFNGTALVFDKGNLVYEGAFGLRSIDPVASLDVNSQFRLASVSKPFTAMAIMTLKESGKLSYDQDIREFIPELPYEGITIRHVLHHVSGLPDYEPLMDQNWKPELNYDDPARYTAGNADVIKMIAEKKPPVRFKPGEKWSYSNTGYNLLGTVVARASGTSFAEYLQEHATAQSRKFKAERPADFRIDEGELNMLGYSLLWAGRVDDSVAICRLTMEEYPRSANAYDSYGDALLAKGDRSNALENFKKAYAMDATLVATKQKIDSLEAEPVPSKQ